MLAFIVTHDVTVIIKEASLTGEVFDSILSLGIYKINGFQWKPNEEVDVE